MAGAWELLVADAGDAAELIRALEDATADHAGRCHRLRGGLKNFLLAGAAERLAERLAEAAAALQGSGPGDWRDAD
jgi:hypothetical protein